MVAHLLGMAKAPPETRRSEPGTGAWPERVEEYGRAVRRRKHELEVPRRSRHLDLREGLEGAALRCVQGRHACANVCPGFRYTRTRSAVRGAARAANFQREGQRAQLEQPGKPASVHEEQGVPDLGQKLGSTFQARRSGCGSGEVLGGGPAQVRSKPRILGAPVGVDPGKLTSDKQQPRYAPVSGSAMLESKAREEEESSRLQ